MQPDGVGEKKATKKGGDFMYNYFPVPVDCFNLIVLVLP